MIFEAEGESNGMTLYKKGMEMVLRSQYLQSLGCFKLAAEENEYLACVILVDLYSESGLVGPKNGDEAARYWALAEIGISEIMDRAHAGEIEACYCYARCLMLGIGGQTDNAAGVKFLSAAAARGHVPALTRFGFCCEKGIGVETVDYDQAFYLYFQAARKEYGEALCNLAFCYRDGKGTEQNTINALVYYFRAAEKGYSRAQHRGVLRK
jgi:TPR repeat protein